MQTAKVFMSGHSQAVRLPKDYRFNANEVEIIKTENEIILREIPKKSQNLSVALRALPACSEDYFQQGREDFPPQERDFSQ
jgi:antitoxin VapB